MPEISKKSISKSSIAKVKQNHVNTDFLPNRIGVRVHNAENEVAE